MGRHKGQRPTRQNTMDPKLKAALLAIDPTWSGGKPKFLPPLVIRTADGRNAVDLVLASRDQEEWQGMPVLVQEDLEVYAFMGGWGDGWRVMRAPARISLTKVEGNQVHFNAGWRVDPFCGGFFRLQDLAKVRELTLQEEQTRLAEAELEGFHVLFDEVPGETGVVLTAMTPKGERFAVARGETIESALSDLKSRVLDSLATVAAEGRDPLDLLGRGEPGHPSAVLLGWQLLPIVQRFRGQDL